MCDEGMIMQFERRFFSLLYKLQHSQVITTRRIDDWQCTAFTIFSSLAGETREIAVGIAGLTPSSRQGVVGELEYFIRWAPF
jgi:hypothetical protein